MAKNGMRPVHPGEILREEFLAPLGLSANALAKAPGCRSAPATPSTCPGLATARGSVFLLT
jgi:hypothetical protein